jgi:hypothetical protein
VSRPGVIVNKVAAAMNAAKDTNTDCIVCPVANQACNFILTAPTESIRMPTVALAANNYSQSSKKPPMALIHMNRSPALTHIRRSLIASDPHFLP